MASYLRPRRGKKATAIAQLTASAPLKRGEIFFEVPDTGVGTGYGNIKMGDGSTGYDALPYFNKQVIVDDTITQASTNPVQSAAIYTALQNIEADLGVELTQAEFDRLTPQQQATGTYYITDGGGSAIAIDTALDANSTNPVQNKAVTASITQLNNDLSAKQDKLSTDVYTVTPQVLSSAISTTYFIAERAYGRVVELSFDFTVTSTIDAHTNIFNFLNIISLPPTAFTFRLACANGSTTNKDFYFSNTSGSISCIESLQADTYIGTIIYLI
jgi:hypothetical protein